MADLKFYKQYLGLSSLDEICKILSDTLIDTNHTYDYFVNWFKVVQNRDTFKYEAALLKSIHNSAKPAEDLKGLLERYPEVVRLIPVLLACRDGVIKMLDSIEPYINYKIIDFSKNNYTTKEIDDVVGFTEKTGLLAMLCQIESATDYLLGVEVGLDTNARKNRSGLFMEKMVKEVISDLVSRHTGMKWMEQKSFKNIDSEFGISSPLSLRNRKFDHVVINEGRATNIEVNFYGGSGSKPSEIVSSYINRNEVLSSAGWRFVWVTDGKGWKTMQRPLRVGVEYIDYVVNTYLIRKGLLENIIVTS
jgi:type II restriction enzyme